MFKCTVCHKSVVYNVSKFYMSKGICKKCIDKLFNDAVLSKGEFIVHAY